MKIYSLVLALCLLTGCVSVPSAPDMIDAGWSHTSHPLQGWPFTPPEDEDSLDTLGLRATWHRERYIFEMSLGKKMGEGGFYGDDLIFNGRMSIAIWERK